jgi:RNA polymerase sigma-70 factor (ECF subfamily)
MQNGDREARFRAVYGASYRAVLAYCIRRTTTPQDAADAVADTFLVAWRRLDDLPVGEAQTAWLIATARRVLSNQRRGERRFVELRARLAAEIATHSLAIEVPSDADERVFADAFARLTPDERDILGMSAWEELSSEQIGAVLGCSPGAARTRLHRARHRLRRLIDATEAGFHETAAGSHPNAQEE